MGLPNTQLSTTQTYSKNLMVHKLKGQRVQWEQKTSYYSPKRWRSQADTGHRQATAGGGASLNPHSSQLGLFVPSQIRNWRI